MYVLFIVVELEHVKLGTDVSAQGSDMGRVVHAKRWWHQRSTKWGFELERSRRTVPGHGNRNRRDAVPWIYGGRRVGPIRMSEPCGVRATGASGELLQDRRNGLENRENVWRVRFTPRSEDKIKTEYYILYENMEKRVILPVPIKRVYACIYCISLILIWLITVVFLKTVTTFV